MGYELLLMLAFDPKSNTDPIAMEKVISLFHTLFPHSALICPIASPPSVLSARRWFPKVMRSHKILKMWFQVKG